MKTKHVPSLFARDLFVVASCCLILLITSGSAEGRALGTDHGTWSPVSFPTEGSTSWGYAGYVAAFDASRRRYIAYNGGDGAVWILSLEQGARWSKVFATGSPPPYRRFTAVLYDPVRDRLLVHGGENGSFGGYNDTWVLPLGPAPVWERLVTVGATPPARYSHSLVYDPLLDRVITFGGTSHSTYELTLNHPPRWSQVPTAGTPPSPRVRHAAILDPLRRRMIVFGGYGNDRPMNELWSLSLDGVPQWVQMTPPGPVPTPRYGHTLAYDPDADQLLLFGGFYPFHPDTVFRDAWTLPLAGPSAWQRLNPEGPVATGRLGHSAGYDPVGQRMLIYGGWEWDAPEPTTWALSLRPKVRWDPVAGPPRRRTGHSLVYDSVRRRLILHGGSMSRPLNDTWILELDESPEWELLVPSGSLPPSRSEHSAIYDPIRNRMIIFGGQAGAGRFNDVWSLALTDPPAWSPLAPMGLSPHERDGHSAVYDPVRDQMVILGGKYTYRFSCTPFETTGYQYLADVWALPLSGQPTWTPLLFSVPGLLEQQSAIYDPVRDRVVVFGGERHSCSCCGVDCITCSTTYSSQLTSITLGESPGHSILAGEPRPTARSRHSAVYDAAEDRMVLLGGRGDFGTSGETWALPLGASGAWAPLSPSGSPPGLAQDHRATLDPLHHSMWIFSPNGDGATWKLSWDRPTPTGLTLVESTVEPGHVHVAWHTPERDGAVAHLERAQAGGDWMEVARLESNSTGMLIYDDRNVDAGRRYGYRLRLGPAGEAEFTEPVWLDVPAFALLLKGARPNPLRGGLAISFTLPDAKPAELAVLDPAGRLLYRRSVDQVGPGEHVLDISRELKLSPGVYFVRLVQGTEVRTSKAIVLP